MIRGLGSSARCLRLGSVRGARLLGSWRSVDLESSTDGAKMVFVIRHAERHDRSCADGWSEKALRPQDTPLSQRGVRQARRLGKWLYGRLPVQSPLAIFVSPFIRCVQTADAIASELEGLQRDGLHSASATRICIEPGLSEDMRYMRNLKCREPWYLKAADLMCVSPRVDINYVPLRNVEYDRGPVYPGAAVERGDPMHRLGTIALELAEHPLVRGGGTALLITHGKPSSDLVRSLCAEPGGIKLPSYEEIKAGQYDGPPLQYTATTALERTAGDTWQLAPGYDLFSNEHDPRLSSLRLGEKMRVVRYVVGEPLPAGDSATKSGGGAASSSTKVIFGKQRGERDLEISQSDLIGATPGQRLVVHSDALGTVCFELPAEYRPGDGLRCRVISDDEQKADQLTDRVLAKRFAATDAAAAHSQRIAAAAAAAAAANSQPNAAAAESPAPAQPAPQQQPQPKHQAQPKRDTTSSVSAATATRDGDSTPASGPPRDRPPPTSAAEKLAAAPAHPTAADVSADGSASIRWVAKAPPHINSRFAVE